MLIKISYPNTVTVMISFKLDELLMSLRSNGLNLEVHSGHPNDWYEKETSVALLITLLINNFLP